MTLVEATPCHAAALAAIHAAAFPPADRWDARQMAELLAMPGCYGWIAEEGGFVLARVAADEAEILTIAVLPEQRQQGLGAGLLAAALREARARGAAAMLLEVAETNIPAQELYGGFGFFAVGKRKNYYPDGGDALVLRVDLGPGQA